LATQQLKFDARIQKQQEMEAAKQTRADIRGLAGRRIKNLQQVYRLIDSRSSGGSTATKTPDNSKPGC
jgi:hypothetical protein